MKIYLATWLMEESQGESLAKVNKKERLLSYYHTIPNKDKFMEYALTGKNGRALNENKQNGIAISIRESQAGVGE
jgi:hypothetical protein